MGLIRILFAASCLLVCLAGQSLGGGDGEETLTSTLMERARAKDIEGLLELETQAMRSPANRYAYHLARFIADPDQYAQVFVAEFPTASPDVMGYVYQLEVEKDAKGQRFTPRFLYSFDQLGNLAMAGNPTAVGKLFEVSMHSDAVVKEFVCEKIALTIAGKPTTALRELAKLREEQRRRVYSCFGSASTVEIASMKSAIHAQPGDDDLTLVKELSDSLDAP